MITHYRRSAAHLFALAGVALAGALPMPAAAQGGEGGYNATLAAPVSAARKVVNGVVWRCDGDSCAAPLDGARPVIACGKMVRAFGTVTRFASPKGELSATDLARCNAAAG